MTRKDERSKETLELAASTVSMLLSLIYLVAVCWIIPVIPVMIVWFLDLSYASFLTLWLGGLPLACLPLYYFVRNR
ncbi:MAG: hypothetical protein ACETV1_05615 [Candidatus Bathyarchaeia archaeon]